MKFKEGDYVTVVSDYSMQIINKMDTSGRKDLTGPYKIVKIYTGVNHLGDRMCELESYCDLDWHVDEGKLKLYDGNIENLNQQGTIMKTFLITLIVLYFGIAAYSDFRKNLDALAIESGMADVECLLLAHDAEVSTFSCYGN